MISKHPTWDILDSSKIQSFMSCPREYFWRYIAGWTPDTANIHLEFGTAWHLAMETLLLKGYNADAVAEAFNAFLKHYRLFWGPEQDILNKAKTPANVLRGLVQYVDLYKDDDFETLWTEIAGSVAINENRLVLFRSDAILKNRRTGKYVTFEHKTGTSPGRTWSDQWFQKIQVGVYSHVLQCHFDQSQVDGVIINGFFPHNEPRMKANGEPYAGEKDNEFLRVAVRRTPEKMLDWLYTINYWVDCIEQEMDALAECKDEDPVLKAFPKNTENCTKYFGCPYSAYCEAWPNPLPRISRPQPGFKLEWWDPRKNLETAKHTVEV